MADRMTKERLAFIRAYWREFGSDVAGELLKELDAVTRERDAFGHLHSGGQVALGDAEKRIAELTGSDFGATPEDCYRAGFRAGAAEAEQRGFERGVESAAERLRCILESRVTWGIDDLVNAVRQLAKPPEQPEGEQPAGGRR